LQYKNRKTCTTYTSNTSNTKKYIRKHKKYIMQHKKHQTNTKVKGLLRLYSRAVSPNERQ